MMGTTEINHKLDQVFDTMGTDDMESVYFYQKNSMFSKTMTITTDRGQSVLNSSRKTLEVVSSSSSDSDDE